MLSKVFVMVALESTIVLDTIVLDTIVALESKYITRLHYQPLDVSFTRFISVSLVIYKLVTGLYLKAL